MINKWALLLLLSFCSSAVWGGFRVGNGGNVIVCQDSTFSLDLYEGEVQGNLHYQKQNMFWKDILAQKIQKLSVVRTPSKGIFEKWLADFDQEAQFVNAQLGKIDDSYHVVKPHDCEVMQAVNQQFNPLAGEKRYIISNPLWNQLSAWDKAALVMHELAYRYLQQETSIQTRAFTALMFSNEVDRLSAKELQSRMDEIGFP